MKKCFEKHDLVKLVGIFIFIAAVLSWFIGSSYYSAGELATEEISRTGIFDIPYYAQLAFYYFTVVFLFIIVVGGFYKFISSIPAYNKLTDNIANVFKGKEKVLVAISTLLFAVFTSLATETLVVFAIVPFVIAILAKLNVDKVTGLVSTFGASLLGVLGATYSTKIVGQLANEQMGLGLTYGYELTGVLILLAVSYIVLLAFTFARMSKKDKNYDLLVDPFVNEELVNSKKKTKASAVPIGILLLVTFVVVILAFIGWETAFGITAFKSAYTWLTEATLFDVPVYSYILGSTVKEFGSWDLLTLGGFLVIMSLIIKLVYRVSFDKLLDGYTEGFKKISKSVGLVVAIYLVLEISVIYPTIAFVASKILSLGTNIATIMLSSSLTSIFTVDFQYTVSTIGSAFASFSNVGVAGLLLQASYGIVQFIAPTSVILMLGLSFLDIKFKDYFKFIWKFMIAIIVIVVIVAAILMYV